MNIIDLNMYWWMNDTLNKIKLRINTLKNRIVHIYCEEDNCCLT